MADIEKIKERFNQASSHYDEQRRFFIPCFEDYYITSISLLSTCRNHFKAILDLGAGTGLLTKFLRQKFPEAEYSLVDVSELMMETARERFKACPEVNYLIADYTKSLPEGSFDLIASALSIHHLEEKSKMQLYSRIFDALEPGGYLMNLDQFNAGSEFLNEKYNEWWYQSVRNTPIEEKAYRSWIQRRELDKENTIEETQKMLTGIGFSQVECIYRFMKFGVVLAIKP